MAEDLGAIKYRIEADTSDLARAEDEMAAFSKTAKAGAKDVDGLGNATEAAGGKAKKGTEQLTSGMDSAAKAIKVAAGALAAFGAAISVREIIAYSDAWQSASNQLRLVTTGVEDLASVQAQLLAVSNDTRSSFESTANLYSRLTRATSEMGLSQKELLDITTTINQSFAVSGATAAEASAAIAQLSQGLAAGALRGDEFNSVAEQAPGIMRAIADSLGMTTGELRSFAAEGGITADIVVKALQQASGSIANDFGKSVRTFGQSMQVAENNMMAFVGGSEAVATATSAAGRAIIFATENLDDLVPVIQAVSAVIATRLVVSLGSAAVAMGTATTAAGALSTAMALLGGPAGIIALTALAAYKLADSLMDSEREMRKAYQTVRDYVEAGNDFEAMADRMAAVQKRVAEATEEEKDAIAEATTYVNGLFKSLGVTVPVVEKAEDVTLDMARAMVELQVNMAGGVGQFARLNSTAKNSAGPLQDAYQSSEILDSTLIGLNGTLQVSEFRMMGVTEAANDAAAGAEFWAKAVEEGARRRELAETQAAEAMQRQWEGTRDFLADTFVDIWDNGGSAFQKLGDMAVATAQRIVAEWAAVKALEFVGIKAPGGSSGVGSSVTSSVLGSILKGGGGGMPGGVAGTVSAGAKIGGMASSAGSAVTGALSAIPGWGWALGGAALIASQLDKSTPSGNAGFLIREPAGGGDGRTFDVPAFASGFDPVGFARREDQSGAVAVIDTFRQYDAALTNIATAAGLRVNYNSNNFGGFSEKGQGGGLFFGSANEDGRNTSVPIEQQLTQFVGQWIKGLGGQVDSSLIQDVLGAGNADAMVSRAAALAGVDGSHANGLDRVPFDGYIAQLHKDERVLTAAEARAQDSGMGDIMGIEMLKLARLSYSILQDWNYRGLPATRAAA